MDEKVKIFMGEGDAYLKTARGGMKRSKIFTPEILYNIIAMAIEKHIMAALMAKGELADNHTFTDLIDATKQIGGIDDVIAESLRKFEAYQNICPVFAGYQSADVPADVIPDMIETADAVRNWTQRHMVAA